MNGAVVIYPYNFTFTYRVCMYVLYIHTPPIKWRYSIYVCKFNLLTISNKSKYSSSKNNYEYLQLPLLQCNATQQPYEQRYDMTQPFRIKTITLTTDRKENEEKSF